MIGFTGIRNLAQDFSEAEATGERRVLVDQPVPATTAILDRFLEHAEILTMAGKSYRMRRRPGAPVPAEAATKE